MTKETTRQAYDAYRLYQRTRAAFDGTDKAAKVLAADAEALLKAQRAAGIRFYSDAQLEVVIDCYKAATR